MGIKMNKIKVRKIRTSKTLVPKDNGIVLKPSEGVRVVKKSAVKKPNILDSYVITNEIIEKYKDFNLTTEELKLLMLPKEMICKLSFNQQYTRFMAKLKVGEGPEI